MPSALGPQASTLTVLYGGTFDPVHNGHLGIARHARDTLRAQVRLMPAADPPHKGPTHADAAQRAEMLRLAINGEAGPVEPDPVEPGPVEPGLVVDLRELRRPGPSYTVDTLRELRSEVGEDAACAILIGADSFRALDTWHRWRELFALAHVVVAERTGPGELGSQPLREGLAPAIAAEADMRWTGSVQDLHTTPAGRIFSLRQPLFPHSASELRRRIALGESWRDQVPPAVAEYILAHGLYR